MKHIHQIVKIRINTIKNEEAVTMYIASNDELGVFVSGVSFRDVLLDLREVLARRLNHSDLSLHFYSAESSQESPPGTLSGNKPGNKPIVHQGGQENHIH